MRSGSISASSCESIQHQGCSYYSGVGSHNGLPHLPSAGPLHQLSAGEQLQLRPSPKKRAVSRGNCGNVPHPSPVYYHCPDSGIASSAATAAPSAATSSSAHFLQPLEQVQSSYARSRYQQQRYDPCASRSVSSKSMAPRMSVSIPSLRKSTHSNSPELEKSSGSSTLSRKGQKGRYILRHQSTAPDIAKVGSMVSGLSSNQFSASLVPFSKDRSTSGIRGGQPHCKPSANSAETPARPLPARLASYGSSAMDASPVNTLVFSESPAASLSLTAPEGYAHSLSAQGSHSYSTQMDIGDSNTRTLTAPPITALSELSVGTKMNTSGNSLHHQYHDSGAHLCSEVGNHFADGANDDCDAVNTSGNSSGWQLRSKILNPLSAWFRLSRHPHPQQSIGNKQHNHTVQHFHSSNGNPSSSNCQPKAHVGGNGVSSTDKRQASKGASAPSVASKRLRDRGVGTCSLSPLYLEPPVAAVPARGNN
ncbi:hypothetical protein GGH99_004568 [Coemansia sp. RSA 1285]|nr:hypothetical protein EV177_003278 [Coemansia sp. RSA 1804]KAJ2682872.1 hypothetical protein GGH99_004568 [Coemansia sp. RSA 1285]